MTFALRHKWREDSELLDRPSKLHPVELKAGHIETINRRGIHTKPQNQYAIHNNNLPIQGERITIANKCKPDK